MLTKIENIMAQQEISVLDKEIFKDGSEGVVKFLEIVKQNGVKEYLKIGDNFFHPLIAAQHFDNQNHIKEAVEKLLEIEGIDPNLTTDIHGFTALHLACQSTNIESISILINDKRVDVNIPSKDGCTPFFVACAKGNLETIKILMNNERVDVNKVDKDGVTPLHMACANGHLEVIKILMNDERIDVNKIDKDAFTPFFVACLEGHLEVIKLLMNDERVDVNIPSKDGVTPFFVACAKGHLELNHPHEIKHRKALE
jgi:ankyrin repeat protein